MLIALITVGVIGAAGWLDRARLKAQVTNLEGKLKAVANHLELTAGKEEAAIKKDIQTAIIYLKAHL